MQEFVLLVCCAVVFAATVGFHVYSWYKFTNAEYRQTVGQSAGVYTIILALYGYVLFSGSEEPKGIQLSGDVFLTNLYGTIFIIVSMMMIFVLAKTASDKQRSPY